MFINVLVGISDELREYVFVTTGDMPDRRWVIPAPTHVLDERERRNVLRMPGSAYARFSPDDSRELRDGDDVYVSVYDFESPEGMIVSRVYDLPAESDDAIERLVIDVYLKHSRIKDDVPYSLDDAARTLIRIDERHRTRVHERIRQAIVDHARAIAETTGDRLLALFIREALSFYAWSEE